MTDYQKRLIDKYLQKASDGHERGVLLSLGIAPKYFDLEDEMSQYIDEHPDATLAELDKYLLSIIPPLEIVDDEDAD